MASFLSKGGMSEAEMRCLEMETNEVHFKSGFSFLNEHKGWRPSKVHLTIAPTGVGKSTWVRSIIWDFLVMNDDVPYKKVFLWLSEETIEEFKAEFARLRLPAAVSSRLIIGSEMEFEEEVSPRDRKLLFAKAIEFAAADLIIFDNITTSEFYADKPLEDQGRFANFLKRISIEQEVPVIVVAHTGGDKQMNKKMLEINDIRGSKAIANVAQFAYILQRFRVYDDIKKVEYFFPTINIVKHRGYVVNNFLFKLKFESLTVHFSADRVIPWVEFKEAFSKQVTL